MIRELTENNGIAQIKIDLVHHEGFRAKPYLDSVGKMTIGVGRNLEDCGISREEAEFMLANDIKAAAKSLRSYLPWSLETPEPIQGVLINMTFNMGIHRLLGFKKALAAMKDGDWETAAVEMLDSRWAKQVGKRSEELAERVRNV